MRHAVGVLTIGWGVMRTLAILAFFVLVGCTIPTMMMKPGAGAQEYEAAKYECQVQESQSVNAIMYKMDPLGNMFYPWMNAPYSVRLCLEDKGWKKNAVKENKPDAVTEQSQPSEQPKTEASTPRLKFGIVPALELTPAMANLLKMDEVGGVFVGAVYADSVASRAGIKKGDVILKYGDKILSTDPNQLKAAVEATPPASVVPITIWRNGSKITLSAQF